MKYILLIAVFVGISVSTQAQKEVEYARQVLEENLLKQLKIIASADMEGRETGTRGQRRAASYIESQFREFGLQRARQIGGFQQFYPLHIDTLSPGSFELGDKQLVYGQDYLLQGGQPGQHRIAASEIVFAGYGIDDKAYNDYVNRDVKGKIALVLTGEPRNENLSAISGTERPSNWAFNTSRKAEAALKHGAKAVLVIHPQWNEIPKALIKSTLKSNLYYSSKGSSSVVITVSKPFLFELFGKAKADEILAAFDSKTSLKNLQATNKIKTAISFQKDSEVIGATNVLAYVEGSDLKDEWVYITAHYDHLGKQGDVIYYGADDDGSGTVAILELARVFAKAKREGHGPRRSIAFIAMSGEEKGLWGSHYYSEHSPFPLDKATVNLNIDMIGRIDPNRKHGDSTNYVYVVGDDKLSSDLRPISVAANEKLPRLELDYKFNDPKDPERIYFRSDHYNFARKGVPIIFYFDGIHADYHRPTDTWDKINYDLLEKRARLVFLTAWEMANRDAMLRRDIPLEEQTR